uniref:Calcineurin-like phosphoesterase domain-containing protein n=1 Tax=Hyaloperonospora arabidopsidis (strain Emoy2) TaxID=559515 RepID=M4C416_HYAAE
MTDLPPPNANAVQTEFHSLRSSTSTQSPRSTTRCPPFTGKLRNAVIAGIVVIALAAAITLIVVLTTSDDDESTEPLVAVSDPIVLPHVAVANLTMVSAASTDRTLEACVQRGWIPTGVDWAAVSASSGPASYLCMQQSIQGVETDVVGAVSLDGVSVMRRIVVVSDTDSCPSPMQTVSNPSLRVFVCAEYISASTAFETQQYVVDLMTTTESFYNHETPGWITWATDLKMDAEATSVYLSARYPVRPIVGLAVLTNATTGTMYSACDELQPLGQWEAPGFMLKSSAIRSSGSSDVVVCVWRPSSSTTGVYSVLTALDVVLPAESCPGSSVNGTEIASDRIKLCAGWGLVNFGNTSNLVSSPATSSFVVELSQYQTTEAEAASFNISSLPGDWDVVGYGSTGDARTFFLTRQYKPFVLNTTSINTANVDSEVSSSVEAVASSSTDELSFRVLQIADMHITGDPDRRCSDSPSSIRDSILAAASEIAQQMRVEGNSTQSVAAGEGNDPLYRECREAVTVAFIDELLDIEQPDFVVFTGDNVHQYSDRKMHTVAMNTFTARVERRKIPWCSVFGNHDTEGGLSREEMLELMTQGKQYSHVKYGPRDIGGVGNYEVNVVAPADGPWGEKGSTVFRMYFLDSHALIDAAAYPSIIDPDDYDWIKESQINFYRELAQSHIAEGAKQNDSVLPNGTVPAVMYYHIPIPEYGLASPSTRIGASLETTYSAAVNSGLFSALLEVGDVKATFVGHDHVNEYCYLRQGVQLCYGGGIGLGAAYGQAGFERQARVLEWKFHANKTRTMRSWQRHFSDPTQIQSLEVLYSE